MRRAQRQRDTSLVRAGRRRSGHPAAGTGQRIGRSREFEDRHCHPSIEVGGELGSIVTEGDSDPDADARPKSWSRINFAGRAGQAPDLQRSIRGRGDQRSRPDLATTTSIHGPSMVPRLIASRQVVASSSWTRPSSAPDRNRRVVGPGDSAVALPPRSGHELRPRAIERCDTDFVSDEQRYHRHSAITGSSLRRTRTECSSKRGSLDSRLQQPRTEHPQLPVDRAKRPGQHSVIRPETGILLPGLASPRR